MMTIDQFKQLAQELTIEEFYNFCIKYLGHTPNTLEEIYNQFPDDPMLNYFKGYIDGYNKCKSIND